MSLEASQKPANGVEAPQQDPPATSATPADGAITSKKDGSEIPSSLNDNAKDVKDPSGSTENGDVPAGQPLEAAKPKEPIEPAKPFKPEAPLPKTDSNKADATTTDVKENGVLTAKDTSVDKEVENSEKMDVDNSTSNLPASDPPTIGDVPAKDSTGQGVDPAKARELLTEQESAKHGHDNDQIAVEEQPPAKRQKIAPVKESNGADNSEAPKRSMSKKKKEPKKATTEDGQPRRSSRLAS